MAAARRDQLERELAHWLPRAPSWEAGEIVAHCLHSRSLARLPAAAAVKLAAAAFVRHTFTDYDALLTEGWGPEAARHAVAQAIDAKLAEWGATRPLTGRMEEPC
ncbi:MAG: DUF2293 domain-containing protein [Actinomycetota bacterium]